MSTIFVFLLLFTLSFLTKCKSSIFVPDNDKKNEQDNADDSSSLKELLNTYALFSENIYQEKKTNNKKNQQPNCSRPAPPRGWDSFDFWPFPNRSVNESQLLTEAELMASLNPGAGLKYIVIDEGWSDQPNPQRWFLDQYGRPIADVNLFPSAALNGSLANLGKLIKSRYGLQLGVWIIKGITKQAVDKKMPIYGTNYTADQIALPSTCSWHKDVFNINMSHPGGQAYYDSIAKLYVQDWGLKYIKIDCIFAEDFSEEEVIGFTKAVEKYDIDNDVVTSLSPGTFVRSDMVPIGQNANLYRISPDLHDCWTYTSCDFNANIVETSSLFMRYADFLDGSRKDYLKSGRGSWPDPDMLPLGEIALDSAEPRWSLITTPTKSRYIYGLWTITRSPIILGGSMESVINTDYLKSMIDNPSLLTVSECTANPTLLDWNPGKITTWFAWSVKHGALPNVIYVGFFAYSQGFNATISISWTKILNKFDKQMPSEGILKVFDVFEQKSLGNISFNSKAYYSITVPSDDGIIYSFIAN